MGGERLMRKILEEFAEVAAWIVVASGVAMWLLMFVGCNNTQPECVSECWLVTFTDDTQTYATRVWYDETSWYVYDECECELTQYSRQEVRLVGKTGVCE